jgi:hypothetical protein
MKRPADRDRLAMTNQREYSTFKRAAAIQKTDRVFQWLIFGPAGFKLECRLALHHLEG